jgi:hypothetical protein
VTDLSKTRATRKRPGSVAVAGKGHPIRTEFCHWLSYDKKLREGGLRPDELDWLYLPFDEGGRGAPGDRRAGWRELHAFYLDEQPLPRSVGPRPGAIAFDWLVDSDLIYAAFMERYRINLIEEDLHWHDFLSLFRALLGPSLNDVARVRTSAAKGREAEAARRAWMITGRDARRARGREEEDLPVMGR